jgi:diguanylate cyclase (GGDEF)-like protein
MANGLRAADPSPLAYDLNEVGTRTFAASGAPSWNSEDTTRIFLPSIEQATPQRVLVVDDDALMRERLEALVVASGFDVTSAGSGREALAILRREYCPIVISDWSMPDMDGVTLCRSIRNESFPGYVYFLLLTARDSNTDIVVGLDAGADDYLSKRVSEAELMARLRSARRIVGLERMLRDAIDEKRRQATTDALTGANNRLYFEKHFDREIKRVRRYGGPLSILALDIDRFKAINDQFGHGVGDAVLAEFATRIGDALPRDSDWFARIGGEEFAVVLPHTDMPGALTVAEKLRQFVSDTPFPTDVCELNVTVSIGVAALCCFPPNSHPSADDVLELADKALYRSKESGRNRVSAAQSVSL